MGLGDGPSWIRNGQQLLGSFPRLGCRIAANQDGSTEFHILAVVNTDPEHGLRPGRSGPHLRPLHVIVRVRRGNRSWLLNRLRRPCRSLL